MASIFRLSPLLLWSALKSPALSSSLADKSSSTRLLHSRVVACSSQECQSTRRKRPCHLRAFSTSLPRPTLQGPDNKYQSRSVQELLSLKGKTMVITGGGRGIGLALTRACVEAGGNVAVLDALPEPHEDFVGLKQDFGQARIEYYKTDVTSLPTLTNSFAEVVKDFGQIDGCVTAAGIVLSKPFIEHEWDETMRIKLVNDLGTFFSAQLAAKQMIAQKSPGSIVLISSITAHHSASNQPVSAYAASKGAVHSLMKALAVELAPYQIRVNSISPGHIYTDMLASLGVKNPSLFQSFESDPPLKRMGNRLDLKLPVVHLLSDGAGYTTGSDLLITGGLHLERARESD